MAATLKIRFQRDKCKVTQTRAPTARRLAAAERHLAKERDRYALFEDEVDAEQPTAEERIQLFEEGHIEFWKNIRNHRAQVWRKSRAWLRRQPQWFIDSFLQYWNERQWGPRDAGNFGAFLRMKAVEAGLDVGDL